MGIPVPSKKSGGGGPAKQIIPKYEGRSARGHAKRSEQFDLENEPPVNHVEEFKRPSEGTRMGNYFNIVIAPPPIKALQPRKLLQSEQFGRGPPKRL